MAGWAASPLCLDPLLLALCCKMIRRLFNVLTIASVLFFVVLAILAAPSFFDPVFEVVNRSNEPVFVVAQWRKEEKEIGDIGPMSSYEFSLDAEGAMRFRVGYPGDGEAVSEPIYFTSGTKVIATISSDAVNVRYDHQQ